MTASPSRTSAFIQGHSAIASTVAFMMNGRNDRFTPCVALNFGLSWLRISVTRPRSTSHTCVTCAAVLIDSRMCFAVTCRTRENV